MVGRIKCGKGSLRIIGVYANRDMEKKIRRIEEMVGGVGGRSKNDNWRRLQSKNRVKRRVSMEGKEEGEEK